MWVCAMPSRRAVGTAGVLTSCHRDGACFLPAAQAKFYTFGPPNLRLLQLPSVARGKAEAEGDQEGRSDADASSGHGVGCTSGLIVDMKRACAQE